MSQRLYLDTSAYLCILLAESGSDRLTKQIEGAQLLSSVLLVLEARRNIVRLSRERVLPPERYQGLLDRIETDTALFVLRDVTIDLCDAAPLPAVATPRSLDLAHLRTALWFHRTDGLDRFLTMDAMQQTAAKELGLPA